MALGPKQRLKEQEALIKRIGTFINEQLRPDPKLDVKPAPGGKYFGHAVTVPARTKLTNQAIDEAVDAARNLKLGTKEILGLKDAVKKEFFIKGFHDEPDFDRLLEKGMVRVSERVLPLPKRRVRPFKKVLPPGVIWG